MVRLGICRRVRLPRVRRPDTISYGVYSGPTRLDRGAHHSTARNQLIKDR